MLNLVYNKTLVNQHTLTVTPMLEKEKPIAAVICFVSKWFRVIFYYNNVKNPSLSDNVFDKYFKIQILYYAEYTVIFF